MVYLYASGQTGTVVVIGLARYQILKSNTRWLGAYFIYLIVLAQ